MPQNSKGASIGLADLIEQVRRDLLPAAGEKADDLPIFGIEEVSLEIGFTIETGVEGGIDIKVVKLGADMSNEKVHRVNVKLSPLLTVEERRTALQKSDRWSEIVQLQADAMLKTLSGGRDSDASNKQPTDLA